MRRCRWVERVLHVINNRAEGSTPARPKKEALLLWAHKGSWHVTAQGILQFLKNELGCSARLCARPAGALALACLPAHLPLATATSYSRCRDGLGWGS